MINFVRQVLRYLQEFKVPFIDELMALDEVTILIIFYALCAAVALLVLLLLRRLIKKLRISATKRGITNFFGAVDLGRFRVGKMGKSGTRYYMDDGLNVYKLSLPHWKKANEDKSKDHSKHFNKVIWEESILWLHAGRNVYVFRTNDPWDMLYLVHALRETGLDIAPCQQELDKQERLENTKRSCDDVIEELVARMKGNRRAFVELCRQRLHIRGFAVSDAPQNPYDIDLFVQKKGRPNIVKCLLSQRSHLTGLDEMRSFKEATEEYFAESCTIITTGHITVAAAGFAREHNVDMICNDDLVELLEENKKIPADKKYLRWELRESDMMQMLPEDLRTTILKK